MLVLVGIAGIAHAVDQEARPETVSAASEFIADRVVESSTWRDGYILVDGIDDYGYGLIETTPNEEIAGERVVRFEEFAQLVIH